MTDLTLTQLSAQEQQEIFQALSEMTFSIVNKNTHEILETEFGEMVYINELFDIVDALIDGVWSENDVDEWTEWQMFLEVLADAYINADLCTIENPNFDDTFVVVPIA